MGQSLVANLKENGIEFVHTTRKCVGFHGTHRNAAESILKNGFDLDRSDSKSWLGHGIYFFDNTPHAGYEAAMCFAAHGPHEHLQPAVIEADLSFALLLDLTDDKNGPTFWELFRLMRRVPGYESLVNERFVAHLIGTKIAQEMGSDGVGYRFPMCEPPARRQRGSKTQNGYAAKTVAAIGRPRMRRSK